MNNVIVMMYPAFGPSLWLLFNVAVKVCKMLVLQMLVSSHVSNLYAKPSNVQPMHSHEKWLQMGLTRGQTS